MTLYLQKLDTLLAVGDPATRHRVAITLCSLVDELDRKLVKARTEQRYESLSEAIVSLYDIASQLCAEWYGVDYTDPDTYQFTESDTDKLLRLSATNATIN